MFHLKSVQLCSFLLGFSFLTCFSSLQAQITLEKRVEVELKDDYVNERFNIFNESGFILRACSKKPINGDNEWKYDLYTTDIEKTNTKSIILDKGFNLIRNQRQEDYLIDFYKSKNGNYQIVSVNVKTLTINQVEGKIPKKSAIGSMQLIGDLAIIEATIKKNSFLYVINWKTGKTNIIPIAIDGFKSKALNVSKIELHKEYNEVLVHVKAKVSKIDKDLYFIRLNESGEKLEVISAAKNIEKNLIDISTTFISKNKLLFTGTYSEKNTSTSTGIFIMEIENNQKNYIEYTPYLQLENFLNYLSSRRLKKIEKKKERKEDKGKAFNPKYYVVGHQIIPVEDEYLYIGEAYYPTYRTETYTTYVNGKPTRTSRRVFDGYQYTHGVIIMFNQQGKIVWNQTFVMWPGYKPFSVRRFIQIRTGEAETIDLVFTSYGQIVSKSFDFDGTIARTQRSEDIESLFDGDKVKYTFSNITFWYDRYFLVYGTQKIKNKTDEVKKKRKVLFISKVKY